MCGSTCVCSLELLSAGEGSVSFAETEAVFVIVPGWFGVALTVIVLLAPFASGGTPQLQSSCPARP